MAGGPQNQQNAIRQLTGLQRYNPMQTPMSGQNAFNYQRPAQQTYQPYLSGTFASRNPGFSSQFSQTPYILDFIARANGQGGYNPWQSGMYGYGGPGTPSGTPGVDAGMDAPNADSGVSASDAPGSGPGGTDGVPGDW